MRDEQEHKTPGRVQRIDGGSGHWVLTICSGGSDKCIGVCHSEKEVEDRAKEWILSEGGENYVVTATKVEKLYTFRHEKNSLVCIGSPQSHVDEMTRKLNPKLV